MAALFLEDADSATKQVVQAACLVRTATAPLLAAMLPHIPADEALDRLRGCHLSAQVLMDCWCMMPFAGQ